MGSSETDGKAAGSQTGNGLLDALRAGARRRLDRLPTLSTPAPQIDVLGASEREKARVERLLKRDRVDARRERKRAEAIKQVRDGKTAHLQDTVIGPTPEQIGPEKDREKRWRKVRIEKLPGSAQTAETMRRVTANRVKQLYDRKVLSDDTYPAVLWYQRQFEACGLCVTSGAAAWGETIRGEPAFGAMPKTAAQAEARHLFRFARGFIPDDMIKTFDAVVLEEMAIDEAAKAARCRYSNAAKMIQAAALLLLGGIVHLLPVRGGTGEIVGQPIDADAGVVTELVSDREVDPIMLDARGLFRPADELAAIARGRGLGLADYEILALLDGVEAKR